MTDKLIATSRFVHNGVWLRVGDEIVDMDEQDRKDLEKMGMIEIKKQRATYMRKVMRPDDEEKSAA